MLKYFHFYFLSCNLYLTRVTQTFFEQGKDLINIIKLSESVYKSSNAEFSRRANTRLKEQGNEVMGLVFYNKILVTLPLLFLTEVWRANRAV